MFERPDQIKEPLYVITTVFNPIRYKTRWKLYEDFAKMVEEAGAILYTAEVTFGERFPAVTDSTNPKHIQIRTSNEFWMKENILNLIMNRLPADWKYVAWIDADVTFSRDDWANETLHQLQHHKMVQMFSQAHDISSDYEIVNESRSFMWCYYNDTPEITKAGYYYPAAVKGQYYWHPGFAWAARREAIDAVGGLIDWAILGNADYLMALILTGKPLPTLSYLGVHGERWIKNWQQRADQHIKCDIGFVKGLLLHHWHGPKVNRAYKTRNKILTESKFDPEIDLKRDSQGLWQLSGNNIKLRDGIRQYFRNRNEDMIS